MLGAWTRRFPWGAIRLVVVAAGLMGLAVMSACPKTGPVCGTGQQACGSACVDLTSDAQNCGACGKACGERQVCAYGTCQCQAGSILCGTTCVDPRTDPNNCGGCASDHSGAVCASTDVCEAGACRINCSTTGLSRCGRSCVDLSTDPSNCGACDHACDTGQSCRASTCTYDVVAACFNSGQVVGIQSGTDAKGALVASSPNPQALARVGDVLLVGDGVSHQIAQADANSLTLYDSAIASGGDIRHIFVDDPYVYVVEDGSHTLQVLQRGDASPDGGSNYATVGQLSLGANSYPQAIAKVDSVLFIPLFGGFGSQAEAAGQAVARVDIHDPTQPTLIDQIPLSGLDLQPFDGGTSLPRPSWIVAQNGRVYAPLNNLRSDYSVGGPGLLARIEPSTGAVSTVPLGDGCLNAGFVAPFGQGLLVSCGGQTDYSASPARTTSTGVVLLDANDQRVSFLSLECPADQPDCVSASAVHLAVSGSRIYVGDASQGRVFVLEVVNGQLVERRGFHAAAQGGQPLDVCPPGPYGSLVSDILASP